MPDLNARILQVFQDAASVTPGTADLARPAHALYVGTAGNVVGKTMNNNTVTFLAVPVGIFDVAMRAVYTATTAAGIMAMYTNTPDNTAG